MNGQFHVPATGWLHALDMRVKLCMTLVVVVLCSVWGNWMFLAAMLVVMHVMLLTDHVPARHVGRLWAVLGPLCALVAVIMLLSMNAYGTGVLYVNRETLPKLRQSYAGYLNTAVPEGGWGAYWENPAAPSTNDWDFPMTARRFEIGGTSNYPGAIALGETLGLVNELGVENIEARILEISTYCMDELERIGGTLITHRDLDHRSGIVIARLYEDLETERQILKELHARKIFIAQRFTDYVGGFRISCQYFNNREDIDRMIEAMEDLIAKIGRKPDYQKKW